MTQKFIIHCDFENIMRAAAVVEACSLIKEEYFECVPAVRDGEFVAKCDEAGTIIVRQCEGVN